MRGKNEAPDEALSLETAVTMTDVLPDRTTTDPFANRASFPDEIFIDRLNGKRNSNFLVFLKGFNKFTQNRILSQFQRFCMRYSRRGIQHEHFLHDKSSVFYIILSFL